MADNVDITAGTGTKIGTDEVTIDSILQHLQRMKMYDGANGSNIPVITTPYGFLRVTPEPRALLNENYDTLDTTNTFTTSNAGGGVAPAIVGGALSIASGTTVNGYSRVQSQFQFKIPAPGWKIIAQALAFPDAAAPIANSFRFWGEGVTTAAPTYAAPLTNAIGFEFAGDGKMYCVLYKGGTRTVIQDLSSATGNGKQPTDANYHLYLVHVRTHKVYFYIDGVSQANLVGEGSFTFPEQQTLPINNMAVAGTGIGSSAAFTVLGTSVSDTTGQNITVGDPDYPWRRSRVNENGALATEVRSSVVTTYEASSGAPFTPPATPTDMFYIQGSATKTVRVLRIEVDATQTAVGTNAFYLIRRTAANTGGTLGTAPVLATHDTRNPTATAVVRHWTANPTGLGSGTVLRISRVVTPIVTSVVQQPVGVFDFVGSGSGLGQPVVLRGTSEYLVVNFNGAALPGGLSINFRVFWTEE